MTGGLWHVYPLLNQIVDCPKGRGKLVQVFTGRAAVQVDGPKKRRRKKKDEEEPEILVFCDPSEIRSVEGEISR